MARDINPTAHPTGWDGVDDGESMQLFVERHLQWLQEHSRRKLSPLLRKKSETGDIVQHALVQFLRYGPRIRTQSDTQLRALLARIVVNVVRDKFDWFTARRRNLARERPLPPDTVLNLSSENQEVETPGKIAYRNEREAWVRLELELLVPDDRRVLILRDWDRLSFLEIGKLLGISVHAARRRYVRSLTCLMVVVQNLRCGLINEALNRSREEPDE